MQPSKIDHESLAKEVKRAQAGELGAFHGLVVRFQDMAVGYAFSLLGDYHLAEDAAQEAFLDAFRKLPTLRHPEAFVSWLRTVVFKHCDRLRRYRLVAESLAEEDERLTADGMEPAVAAEQAEIARLVGKAIGSLPAGQREVVSLYYIGQRSGRQVATFLDLPLTTVKKRLHDAKPKLRRSMSGMAKQFLETNRPSRDARFADRVLRLASPDPSEDAAAIYNLFEAEDHPARGQWRAGRLADSHADWNVSRVAFASGGDNVERVVAALNAYDLTMRVGTGEVRAAGINGDVVHPDIAGQRGEILEQTAAAAVGAMRKAGYDLAVAFDDDALWLQQGFTRGWRALTWRVATADLPAASAPALERIDAVHRDDLATACNATHSGLTGTVRRPTYRLNKHPDLFKTYCWDTGGDTRGYVSVDPESDGCLWVDEAAGDASTCLAALRSIAGGLGCEELLFDRLHYKSPVGVRLRQMSSCRLATGTRLGKARWYLLKIIDLKSTMTKLAPMLHERLLASELSDWQGTLALELRADGGTQEAVTLAVQDGTVQVHPDATGGNGIAGTQAIAQLLLGTEDPAEIVAENGIAVRGDAKRLLPVLFPPQHPQMENQAL